MANDGGATHAQRAFLCGPFEPLGEEPRARAAPVRIGSSAAGVAIHLERVTKVFASDGRGAVTAIADVSLDLAPGASLLVNGPTGCGKTTLLALVGCVIRPTAGRIRVGDLETARLHEDLLAGLRRRRFGFIFQRPSLVAGATALLNVMIPALPTGRRDRELADTARRLLVEVGLEGRIDERVDRLSGGEQQRVALARALVNDPDVLVADEPTAHQDLRAKEAFLDLVERFTSSGRTVVASSHDPFLATSGAFSERIELAGGAVAGRERR